MRLEFFDWLIVLAVVVISIIVSIFVSRKSSKNSEEFFLSGRAMPWWLLGASMVATTFSTDTPNLVADITRTNGIAGNWAWWAFLLTGMTTAFLFARLWRRSGVVTDIEFYEERYSGRIASFLRVFRAVYLGFIFNVMIMAAVTLAAIKIGAVMFGLSPIAVVLAGGGFALMVSIIGGLRGVIYTDFLLFAIAMLGAFAAAHFALALPQVGGLEGLFSHPDVIEKSDFFPNPSDPDTFVPLILVPLLIQWWSVWYPGSEPGGGGYVAQRMLAAKSQDHALGAVLFFNFAHYVIRPWPWIIVALASIIIFPDLESLRRAFPEVEPGIIGHDLGYPAMLTFIPSGWLGLVVASLVAAYMSTISTSLNLGASYFTKDIYQRFVRQDAEVRQMVLFGRVVMAILMIATGFLALQLQSALQAFSILLSIGAGTGLIFMLRWYWERINAWSELTAMVVSFAASIYFQFADLGGWEEWEKLIASISITTIAWISVTYLTPRTDPETLKRFFEKVQPNAIGWRYTINQTGAEIRKEESTGLGAAIFCVFLSCTAVYGALFGSGFALKANFIASGIWSVVSIAAAIFCWQIWMSKFSKSAS